MDFSARTGWNLMENAFTAAVRERRRHGGLLDLTVANPTACGFTYDEEEILCPLSQAAALQYEPEPFGMTRAREAVVQYYREHNAHADTRNICLTTSTSEAYSYLFRLLCDPEDEVLTAQPSYPLFDYIAQLDGIALREYAMVYDPNAQPDTNSTEAGWFFDLHAVETAITPRTRAILLVHPNNPTGSFASAQERVALMKLCACHGLVLIVDEVFLDYPFDGVTAETFASGMPPCLTFVLSGLSKICALPQMKCSWIVTAGPDSLVQQALARLEIIADTYLSMNAPVQHALPFWLGARDAIQRQIRARMKMNLAALDERLRGTQVQRLIVQGGWTVVLRVPREVKGEAFALAALGTGVLVQPGEFYGLPESRVVLSLLTPTDVWQRALALLPFG